MTGLKLPFWGLIFGGRGAGPPGPPPGSAPDYIHMYMRMVSVQYNTVNMMIQQN